MSTPKKKLSKTAEKKRTICHRGHKLVITKEGDAEVPATCSDYCGRCGHRFSRREAQVLATMSGVWTESLEHEVLNE